MSISLQQKRYRWGYEYWHEVMPTRRWMIETINNKRNLYLEIEREEMQSVLIEPEVKFLLWVLKKEIRKEDKKIVTEWVHELDLRIVETHINNCGE